MNTDIKNAFAVSENIPENGRLRASQKTASLQAEPLATGATQPADTRFRESSAMSPRKPRNIDRRSRAFLTVAELAEPRREGAGAPGFYRAYCTTADRGKNLLEDKALFY